MTARPRRHVDLDALCESLRPALDRIAPHDREKPHLPAAHRALLERRDVLAASAPALSLGGIVVVLLPRVELPPDLRGVELEDGVVVAILPLERALEVVGARSLRAADVLLQEPGALRAWLCVLSPDGVVSVGPLARPMAVAAAQA